MKNIMRKLFGILFVFALFSVYTFAQVTARTAVTYTMGAGVTYYEYTGVAADTVGTEKDTLYFAILTNKNEPVTCNARIELTRTGTTETYDIDLEGKVFANDSWAKIVESAAQVASKSLYDPETSMVDSTGVANAISGNSNHFYRYFRVFLGNDGTCGAADKMTVNKVIFKLYNR